MWDSQHNDASAAGIFHVGMGSSTRLTVATAELEPAEELSDKLRRGLSRKSALSNGSTLILGSKKCKQYVLERLFPFPEGQSHLNWGLRHVLCCVL